MQSSPWAVFAATSWSEGVKTSEDNQFLHHVAPPAGLEPAAHGLEARWPLPEDPTQMCGVCFRAVTSRRPVVPWVGVRTLPTGGLSGADSAVAGSAILRSVRTALFIDRGSMPDGSAVWVSMAGAFPPSGSAVSQAVPLAALQLRMSPQQLVPQCSATCSSVDPGGACHRTFPGLARGLA